jgi:hypothetical protein
LKSGDISPLKKTLLSCIWDFGGFLKFVLCWAVLYFSGPGGKDTQFITPITSNEALGWIGASYSFLKFWLSQ